MKEVKSCDIYDTIIARKCIYPNYIFFIMEARLGMRGFLKARILACSIATVKHQGEHTFERIYDELVRLLNLTSSERARIMELEVALELDNVIPIADNLNELSVDTLLISDMYLPINVIQLALDKVGVGQRFLLLKSSTGKYTGKIWNELFSKGFVCNHLGDNKHSDIQNAVDSGMKASLTTISAPTCLEKSLMANGLTSSAFLIRESRLRVMKPNDAESSIDDIAYNCNLLELLISLQVNVNLPMLLKIALYVLELAATSGDKRTLMFSSRGSYLLFLLCNNLSRKLGFSNLTCRYWLSSRDARMKCSHDYIQYCLSLFDDKPIFVDLNGSGTSFTCFAHGLHDEISLDADNFIVGIYHEMNDDRYTMAALQRLSSEVAADNILPHCCFKLENLTNGICYPEQLNFSPEGKLIDVKYFGGSFLPIRECYEFMPLGRRVVQYSQSYCAALLPGLVDCFPSNYAELKEEVFSENYDFCLKKLFEQYYESAESVFIEFFRDGHMRNEHRHICRVARRRE